ncbi:MAG: XRE family transcriptional regulator [Muribaculaceae bacterium]|nr:XRE family transcriptional regulator [Muribaculaceae bacterium]
MKITENTLNARLDSLAMPDAKATIADRIRYLIVRMRLTQAGFGERIGVDPSNMSKILGGRLRITDRVINRIVINLGVSKNWLVNGTDVPFPREGHDLPTNIPEGVGHMSLMPTREQNGAPVYDIDVTAGCQELSRMFTQDRIIGYFDMPSVNTKNPLVRVSGNSMVPDIADGSFIQIRPVSPTGPIFWGSTYVVVTEDYRMVKVLRRHPDRDKVILHSANPNYDDMELDRFEIKSLFIVEAVLNYNIMA